MEHKFHLFVRRFPGLGYAVSALGFRQLAAFADDVDAARADIAHVAAKLLARNVGGIADQTTHWPDLRLRRVELTIRAVQQHRLLPVPMRFTVLTHGVGKSDEHLGDWLAEELVEEVPRGRRNEASSRGLVVYVPRLGITARLAEAADLDAFVEELIRRELYMVPLARLLEVAYDGEETVETLAVAYKPRSTGRADDAAPADDAKAKRGPVPPALGEACRRLNDEATRGTLERAFRRDAEVAALLAALAAARRASVLLVGAPGAGKTAVLHEAVHRMELAEGGAPGALRGTEVYSTSGGRIIAGMRYLGQWQQRLQRMIDELRVRRAVLHLEGLSEVLSTGSSDAGLDVARYLLPAIEAGDVSVVCEASPEDLARAERTHPAFVRALRPLQVEPLAPAAAMAALHQVAARLGRARKVRFTDAALVRAMDLTERFGDGAALPGGAVQLLRAAAQPEETTPRPGATSAPRAGAAPSTEGDVARGSAPPAPAASRDRSARVLDADAITRAFTLRTGYPREIVDPSVPLDPDAVLERFHARVVGQDAAMVLLRDLVVTLKTALSDPARPLGSFLLLGPTGVGKTESALALAEYLFGDEKRMARFDMSEYAAPGSATRLVSQYGGTEGALARRVREQPFGVVLLDEVEKADTSVHDLLLQILGEGRLTDATGRTVSFRNTIVVLTSNLGAESAGRSLGFDGGRGAARAADAHYLAAAAAFFRPELLNRFDHVVPYHPLSRETVAQIARRAIARALTREGLTRRGVRVRYDDAVVERIAALGFEPRYGARPLNRAVARWIVAPLARVLAARGAGVASSELEIVVRGDAVAVAPSSAPEVAALDPAALAHELARRAAREARDGVALRIAPEDVRARRHADWLASRYRAWCEAQGVAVEVAAAGASGEAIALRARGGAAALLRHECGAHDFETEDGELRVWVRPEGARPAPASSAEEATRGARLYSALPTSAVLDGASGLEFVGPWDSALAGDGLTRFVLARAAAAGG